VRWSWRTEGKRTEEWLLVGRRKGSEFARQELARWSARYVSKAYIYVRDTGSGGCVLRKETFIWPMVQIIAIGSSWCICS
jgi:hypothetical protein